MTATQPKAVALLSGGLDSTVSFGLAHATHTIVLALTVNYGQTAFAQELKAATALAAHYNVPHQVIDLPWLGNLLPKAMDKHHTQPTWDATSETDDPTFWQAEGVWVPNRNGLLINLAGCFAEYHQADVIIFGGNADEAEAFADNTEAFRQAITHSLSFSTLNQVHVMCPVGHKTKAEIIQMAQQQSIPLDYVWSCYTDNPTPCGHCPSCVRLNAAKLTLIQ